MLSVHQETQTLIFKGTAAQQQAITEVIAALTGSRDAQNKMRDFEISYAHMLEQAKEQKEEIARLRVTSGGLKGVLDARDQKLQEQAAELQRLRAELQSNASKPDKSALKE